MSQPAGDCVFPSRENKPENAVTPSNILAPHRLTILALLMIAQNALADVTVQEKMSLDVSILKAHTTETNYYAGEKKRHEYLFACDGMMKFLCGKQKNLDIERVDQGVSWRIDDKQRTYLESGLISPEQAQTAVRQQQAAYEKLRSCPAARSAGPDISKCEMSEPQIAVTKTGDHAMLLGHDTQRTNITLSQSCKVRQTGEECQLAYEFDVWLTQDKIDGVADRRAFEQAYLKKQGMSGDAMANPTLARAMAPYADSFRKLSAKSGDLKGLPLRTRFRFAYGGAHCRAGGAPDNGGAPSVAGSAGASARSSAESSTTSAAGWSTSESVERSAGSGPAGYIAGSTAGAFARSLVGGMFAKHRAAESTTAATSATPTAPSDATITTGTGQTLQTFADMTIETVSIDATPVPPARFEIPAGYKKLTPAPSKTDETPSCPNS